MDASITFVPFAKWAGRRRPATFLTRNLRSFVASHLSPALGLHASSHISQDSNLQPEEHDLSPRPSKRRRTQRTVPENGIEEAEPLFNFARRSCQSCLNKKSLCTCTPWALWTQPVSYDFYTPPQPFHRALRIDVSEVKHLSSTAAAAVSSPAIRQANIRCTLTISYNNNEEAIENDGRPTDFASFTPLLMVSQIGTIDVTDSIAKSVRHIHLLEPFVVPVEQIYVNQTVPVSSKRSRKFRKSRDDSLINGDMPLKRVFTWAKQYHIQFKIEAIGFQEDWLPLDLKELSATSKIGVALQDQSVLPSLTIISDAEFPYKPNQQMQDVPLKLALGRSFQRMDSTLRIKSKWTTPSIQSTKLSAPASRVIFRYSYAFPGSEDEKYHQRNFVDVEGFTCALCETRHGGRTMLNFHLATSHSTWKFEVLTRSDDETFTHIRICPCSTQPRPNYDPEKTFHLAPSKRPFDLRSYLDGDLSWIEHRQEPDNIIDQYDHPSQSRDMSTSAASPEVIDSPTTSISNAEEEEDEAEDGLSKSKTRQRRKYPPRQKWFIVPKTDTRLLDTVTRRVLKPGETELHQTSQPSLSKSWFAQRHADIVNDFEDFADAEKDFLVVWNEFLWKEKITHDIYLPRAIERFLAQNIEAGWFGEGNENGGSGKGMGRVEEFSKVMIMLMLRNVVSAKQFDGFTKLLRGVVKRVVDDRNHESGPDVDMPDVPEDSKGKGEMGEQAEITKTQARGYMECVCGRAVLASNMLICNKSGCKARHFHIQCIPGATKKSRGKWTCNICTSNATM